ncbi:hypothetical protein GY45DRAFT_1106893 [Cubamyces sp. BRFM 1775]|nr:hypothetical protein GY45DRAFT_1106893 [Cubamyces sp. BRFM 1775]
MPCPGNRSHTFNNCPLAIALLRGPPVLSYPTLSYPTLSSPVVSSPVISSPVVSSPVVSSPVVSSPVVSSLALLSSVVSSPLVSSRCPSVLIYTSPIEIMQRPPELARAREMAALTDHKKFNFLVRYNGDGRSYFCDFEEGADVPPKWPEK